MRRRENKLRQAVEAMVVEAVADKDVAALDVAQVLAVAMVHILVINGAKAMHLLILTQFVGFKGSHMPFVTRPIMEHSAVGIPPILPNIILQL